MSRSIRFRVWDKNKKAFVSPSSCAITGNGTLSISDSGWYSDLENVNFNDFVKGQWAGLQDKNGKDIYENDIVEFNKFDGYIEIAWNPELLCLCLKFCPKDKRITPVFEPLGSDLKLEIVGNIFENPELLQEKHSI